MLIEEQDIKRSNDLMDSLRHWANTTYNIVDHKDYEKKTGTLYRFGWFIINDYKYSISGWAFKTGIITFEDELTGEKIKYNMRTNDVLNNKFRKDGFISGNIKKLRVKTSSMLRKLSDKLQP